MVPAAKPGGVMKHCLLPSLLTVLQGAPGLCQHFPLPGTCLNFPPASILTVSPGTVVPFDFAHPSQQCLIWTQFICLHILPTSLVKSWCSAACPACLSWLMLFYVPPSQCIGERCPVFNRSLFPLPHSPAQVSPSPHSAQNFITPLLAQVFFSRQWG